MSDDGRMQVQREQAREEEGADSAPPAPGERSTPAHPFPRVASFRSRRSALSGLQRETWDRRWPELGRQARDSDGRIAGPLDTEAWFGRVAPLVLEIGCGTGVSTLAMAAEEPELDVIAVEVYKRGLAQLLNGIDREGLNNVRLIRGDGVDVLEHLLPPASLTGVRVFFPDPWPKARHHKRRLLQPATVALIADRLRPGGILHAATDHPGYAEQIGEVGDAEPRLRRLSFEAAGDTGAGLPISVHRPVTKYEDKAQRAGSAVAEFVWEKA
ncbi:tRNA (guanosine(46)-N7)-methyltransferase TrmB [Mycolicibacterium sp. 050158]|jgi:tRNA (guanine-N7-)-methyltransferase|uniref:tRNA (guanosine(46)-N7)-methyltransferase TrmB n=1 Tax=Mycolicibacterium sp. 050158 TaxID=3090602 RepID=UPI00299D0892|nr:tRNA (guanosine(46)-N7)-methyltransferase TrmB [Mycolicibacterium sp. 050158]MDX1892255.1 tRNA (guanosine(46)-N7)-methyltransferase TrmB [Mycolicibacterium sp. 050158]